MTKIGIGQAILVELNTYSLSKPLNRCLTCTIVMVSVLALSFHPAFVPPKSGGEQRLYNIYNYLSAVHNITLISFTHPNSENIVEYVHHNSNFTEIRIPKTKVSSDAQYLINRLSDIKECSGVITSIESRFNRNFREIVEKEIQRSDVVIFVHPYLFTLGGIPLNKKYIVYESYNVEYELMEQTLHSSLVGKLLLRYLRNLESGLLKKSNLTIAVSEENKGKFYERYGVDPVKIRVFPNGVNPDEFDALVRRGENRRVCLFMGSYHPPNIQAIDALKGIATLMPDVQFIVAGSASNYFLQGDLTDQGNLDCLQIIGGNIVKICGLYDVEQWGSTVIAWSKPEFHILAPEDAEQLELYIYSPSSQRLEATGECEKTFNLEEGWGSVKIPRIWKRKGTIRLNCERATRDQRGLLGVAVSEIAHYKDGRRISADIAGSMARISTLKGANNILLMGQVSEEEKRDLYKIAGVALNPMLSGSGTNVKMLEYMAAGLPVITTPVGARGLEVGNNRDVLICDISEFPEKITDALNNRKLYDKLSKNGRRLVEEKYDWKRIAQDMARTLKEIAV